MSDDRLDAFAYATEHLMPCYSTVPWAPGLEQEPLDGEIMGALQSLRGVAHELNGYVTSEELARFTGLPWQQCFDVLQLARALFMVESVPTVPWAPWLDGGAMTARQIHAMQAVLVMALEQPAITLAGTAKRLGMNVFEVQRMIRCMEDLGLIYNPAVS